LFTVASALSLLFCAAIVVLGVRSFWTADTFQWTRDNGSMFGVRLDSGGLSVADLQDMNPGNLRENPSYTLAHRASSAGSYYPESSADLTPQFHLRFVGFEYERGDVNAFDYECRFWIVPIWIFLLPGVILPARWVLNRRCKQTRAKSNKCLHCGYDLRASIDRCSECGTPIMGGSVMNK
jgi:hypothetical protein